MLLKFIEKIRNMDKEKDQQLKQNNKGFTLVELLVAIVILTMVMMPISRLFITAGGINKKARLEQQANITANSILESARAFPLRTVYNQVKANSSTNFKKIVANIDDSFTSSVFTQYDNANTSLIASAFKESNATYAFKLNGLKQNTSLYDAVLIYEKVASKDILMNNAGGETMSETQLKQLFKDNDLEGMYYKQYNIRVYVYTHDTDISSETFSPNDKGNALVMLTGSKLDSAN